MDYTLNDIINGLDLPLNAEVPLDFDTFVFSILRETSEEIMDGKELVFCIVNNWIDRHCLIDYDEDRVKESIDEWYEDFFC